MQFLWFIIKESATVVAESLAILAVVSTLVWMFLP